VNLLPMPLNAVTLCVRAPMVIGTNGQVDIRADVAAAPRMV
jgi:hypothetical protein